MDDMTSLLRVKNLSVEYRTDFETVKAVNGITFSLNKGETFGLVGETGAGKTTTALTCMRLLPENTGHVTGGEVEFEGINLLDLPEPEMQKIRGERIAMIFQDPMTSLNPVMSVGEQIEEALLLHNEDNKSKAQIQERVDEVLSLVGIPASRKYDYPHQFSGGMKQRVVIAMALSCEPLLLIADEPTTALDVTIQAQVIGMIRELRERLGTAMIMITHDLGIVAQTCDNVAVMYAGKLVEIGKSSDIFLADTHHPYTAGLFGSIPNLRGKARRLTPIPGLMPDPTNLPKGCGFSPRCPRKVSECDKIPPYLYRKGTHQVRCHLLKEEKDWRVAETVMEREATVTPLIETRGLKKYFKVREGWLHAVDDVNISILSKNTLGVVGESGCGKSTLGRAILRLLEATEGQVIFNGENILSYNRKRMREIRKKMQIIFQDPYSSIDPRMSVAEIIVEYMLIHKTCSSKAAAFQRAAELMDTVGLARRYANAYPHELDGGRRQRIGIARALSLDPEFIVCDEPVSALDVSIQAQILNLLMDIQEERGLTYMFITHNLSVVKHISDEIVVMYLGQCVEHATSDDLFNTPLHPYTKALLSAIPEADITLRGKEIKLIKGELTSPINPPPGCRFAARCEYAQDICRNVTPSLRQIEEHESKRHFVACHIYEGNVVI